MSEVIAPEADQEKRRGQMRALARKPMTADEFLYAYEGVEGRWELVRGVPVMMAGGTIRHGRIARNILAALTFKLRGSSCQPFGSDVGIQVDLHQIRYPDISVLCDPRDVEVDEVRTAHFPALLFEVFSPSTAEKDRGLKLIEYKRLPTVKMIVHVDPATETVATYERLGAREWRERTLEQGDTLVLDASGVALTAEDMFRRD